jgi:hypothetical protein
MSAAFDGLFDKPNSFRIRLSHNCYVLQSDLCGRMEGWAAFARERIGGCGKMGRELAGGEGVEGADSQNFLF